MIKFFRHIRQHLIMKNKTSKYVKYAIGEIILVVIGILIALQINTWNEQRKANMLEAEYYCRLFEDLVQDQEQVETLIKQTEDRLKASNQSLRLLQKDNPNKIEVATQIDLSTKAIFIDFKPNNSAFEDLKSGANLSIIKDKNVIKALNAYYNTLESTKSIIKINGQNAVDIAFAHNDSFENGKTASSILYGKFKDGLDADLIANIKIDTTATLSETMQFRFYNESLRNAAANLRQLELYNILKEHTLKMTELLEQKCDTKYD
ncbi:DUF6090 family protein [Psychroserpens mesophilus]|uniref:DUF6090 family protein n=1 Tax=Psychroserpens mesophilus TaxID=325473 RepID=UPI003D657155